jgi:hypothetical protein
MLESAKTTTYVLGAGASWHAGYPLCSELWPRMAMWVLESHDQNTEYRQAIDAIISLNGRGQSYEVLPPSSSEIRCAKSK